MLSKEEIKKAKECLQETIQNTYAEGKAIKLNNVLKYIDQLESDKQKLIEKLEEDIREETGYAKWVDSNTKIISSAVTTMISKSKYAKEILEILKKE